MKFKINGLLLKECVAKIQGGLGGQTLSSLHIKIQAQSGEVTFYTNNAKIGYTAVLSGIDIKEEGCALINGEVFINLINFVSDKDVSIESDAVYFNFYDGKRKTKLTVFPETDFVMPIHATDTIATVDIDLLKTAIKAALPLSATDMSVLEGISMGASAIVATDRTKGTIIKFESDIAEPIVLTKEGARELLSIDHEGTISLMSDGGKLTVMLEGEKEMLILTILLLQERFPDFTSHVYKLNFEKYITVAIDKLYTEINYISSISSNRDQLCTLVIDAMGTLGIRASSDMNTNTCNTEIDINLANSVIGTESFVFKTQVSNMLIMLKTMKSFMDTNSFEEDSLRIDFIDSESPIKLSVDGLIQLIAAAVQ